jgi:hypothetical protein
VSFCQFEMGYSVERQTALTSSRSGFDVMRFSAASRAVLDDEPVVQRPPNFPVAFV